MSNRANLANSLLAAPLADTDTTLTVETGDGALFPATPFYATLTEKNKLSRFSNSEIVLVTNVSTDTLTITRAQRGTSALDFDTGDIIANGFYTEDLDEKANETVSTSAPSSPATGDLWYDTDDTTSLISSDMILDEDDFATDSATKAPSQQSTRQYVLRQQFLEQDLFIGDQTSTTSMTNATLD